MYIQGHWRHPWMYINNLYTNPENRIPKNYGEMMLNQKDLQKTHRSFQDKQDSELAVLNLQLQYINIIQQSLNSNANDIKTRLKQ